MAADGAATYGAMGQMTVRQPTKKLEILSGSVIVGVSGTIGLAQRYSGEIGRLWTEKKLVGKAPDQAMREIQKALRPIIQEELDMARVAAPVVGQGIAGMSALSQTLVAMYLAKTPCLFQFDQQGSPEAASNELPFASVGSAQSTADPFLAFIRDLFWREKQPTVAEGIFAAHWTVRHAIQTSPGGVADPIQVVVLEKGKTVRELTQAELEEQERVIGGVQEAMRTAIRRKLAPEAEGAAPPPEPPA